MNGDHIDDHVCVCGVLDICLKMVVVTLMTEPIGKRESHGKFLQTYAEEVVCASGVV